MVFGRIFGKGQTARFECVYNECGSLCCKKNLVVLNEDDVAAFREMALDTTDVTERLRLNEFLSVLGSAPMKQLEGLDVLKLKKDEAGNCIFLKPEEGVCKIYDRRPYYCREFPFKLSKGKIKKTDPICPGVNRGDVKDPAELKRELGLVGLELKPPYLVGDEKKLKTSRTLMKMVFRLMR
jgi:Fe-S-cluster containining protein